MLHHKNQTPDFSFKNLLLVFHWTEPLFTTNLSASWMALRHRSVPKYVSCSVLSDSLQPMDYNLPSFSVHGILQATISGVSCHSLLQGTFLTQGSNPGSALQSDSLPSEPPGKPRCQAKLEIGPWTGRAKRDCRKK